MNFELRTNLLRTNVLRKNFEYVVLALILGLAFYIAYIPHIDYPYPIHMDEWRHLANAKTMMAAGDVDTRVPYLIDNVKGSEINLEAGLHLFIGLFQGVSGIGWMSIFRYLPPVIFLFTVLAAYLFGKRRGFGWEAALMTCLIITTIGIMGPAFLVPVSFGLPFVVLGLYFAYNFRHFWGYIAVLLMMSFLLCLHPPTAIGLGILLLPYVVLNLKGSFKHALGLSLAAGVPLLPALLVVDWEVVTYFAKQFYSDTPLGNDHIYPELIPEFGYIPVACCLLGLVILVRRGGREAWGLVAGFVLLLLMLVIKKQFDYGMGILYFRGLMYTMLIMAIISGCGLAAIKGFKLPERLADKLKPVFLARNAGNILCIAVIAATFSLAIPDRQNEDYYHKIDEDDYESFIWIDENLGEEYGKAILDPFQAVALIAITGKEAHSDMGNANDARARETHLFLNSGCNNTEFLKKNGISIVYTWQECNNPDLTRMRENVYVFTGQ